jgi:hypothetical protein
MEAAFDYSGGLISHGERASLGNERGQEQMRPQAESEMVFPTD